MYKLNPNNCQIENRRGQRQTPRSLWTSWKVLSGCAHSCINNAPGLRLVTRECLAPSCQKGLRRSVQLCSERLASSSHHCTKRFSVQEFTNRICSKYKVCIRRNRFTFYRKIILMLPIFIRIQGSLDLESSLKKFQVIPIEHAKCHARMQICHIGTFTRVNYIS